jgi:thiamine biosynthesis lipoprotein
MTSATEPAPPASGRPWRRGGLAGLALLFVAAIVLRALLPAAPPVHRFEGEAFGSTWSAIVIGGVDAARLTIELETELRRLNGIFSTYADDTELARFNAHAGSGPVPVGEDLRAVVADALAVAAASGGAFDPTVAPLVRRWGFGRGGPTREPPGEEELLALRARTGYGHLRLTPAGLVKDRPELELDLGGIAPGYAADRLSAMLTARGCVDHYVEIGGEVRCAGKSPRGDAWRVGVQLPVPGSPTSVVAEVPLRDLAVATSGEYRTRRMVEGVRVSHTIDPQTGRPIDHALASVTVIDPRCARADAWATALNVLGPVAGPALAREQDLAALFIVDDGGRLEQFPTRAWTRLVATTEGDGLLTVGLAVGLIALAMLGLGLGRLLRRRGLRGGCGGGRCAPGAGGPPASGCACHPGGDERGSGAPAPDHERDRADRD